MTDDKKADPSNEEAWTLTTERIEQVLADVRKTPCPLSAHCPDDVSRVQFALHIIAEKALAELLDHRGAGAASADRVREVVREAFGDDPHRESRWPRVEAIADRIAAQLTAPASGPVCRNCGSRTGCDRLIALIAYTRELEGKLVEVRNDLRDGCFGQREIDALLAKGAILP